MRIYVRLLGVLGLCSLAIAVGLPLNIGNLEFIPLALAQPAALTIDRAKIDEIVGTVAGDDTILIAVKNVAAQRLAMKKIVRLFAPALHRGRAANKRAPRSVHTGLWPR